LGGPIPHLPAYPYTGGPAGSGGGPQFVSTVS
jgi:hypothetical protein